MSQLNNFSKDSKLRKKKDFDRFKTEGFFLKRNQKIFFGIKILENDLNQDRLGLAIRNASSAPKRNRIKRVCREIFRKRSSKGSKDYLLVFDLKKSNQIDETPIVEVLDQLWKKF